MNKFTLPLWPLLISFLVFMMEIVLVIRASSIWMGLGLMALIIIKQCCWMVAFSRLKITTIER